MDAIIKPPRHFWPAAIVSVLWNAFGAYDYLMTNTRNAAYLAQFPPEMKQYVDAVPYWALGVWALGVWGAVLGAILMLQRSRFSVHAFAISLLGLVVNRFYQASDDMPEAMMSGAAVGMTVVIWIGAFFQLWYSQRMRRAGVLR